MGLSTKQVSGDQGIENWAQTDLLQSDAAELSKQPPIRRQPPLQQQSETLKCPRCGSTNTKFCYYNNYNKSQPRHFCKGCKRHWTKGGTLRNVPVGGGRKNKRPKISNAATTTTTSAAATTTTASLPSSANTANNQKNMSNILYQALIRNSSTILHETNTTTNSTGLNNISAPQNTPNSTDLIQFSSLSNTSLIYPTSYQSFDNHYIGNLDSLEESTITTVNINPSSSSELWPGPDTSSTLDLPNYWNWNDIDVLSSADLNISWDDQDDAEIKP